MPALAASMSVFRALTQPARSDGRLPGSDGPGGRGRPGRRANRLHQRQAQGLHSDELLAARPGLGAAPAAPGPKGLPGADFGP